VVQRLLKRWIEWPNLIGAENAFEIRANPATTFMRSVALRHPLDQCADVLFRLLRISFASPFQQITSINCRRSETAFFPRCFNRFS
jgi:hypothetical protein